MGFSKTALLTLGAFALGLMFGATGTYVAINYSWPNSGRSDIQAECSTSGVGQGRCVFHNKGTKRGDSCVRVLLTLIDPDGYREMHGELVLGRVSISSSEVCSGNLAAGDLVERNYTGFKNIGFFTGLSPRNTNWEDGILPVTPRNHCIAQVPNNDDWDKGCRLEAVSPDEFARRVANEAKMIKDVYGE